MATCGRRCGVRRVTVLPEHQADPRRLALGDLGGKYSLQIQTTTACNARCVFCPHADSWGARPARRMTDSTFGRVVQQMQRFRFFKVAPYLQNEPLTDHRIFDFTATLATALRFDVLEIACNPVAATPARARRLADCLAGIPHEIRLSFHGVDARSFECNMGLDFDVARRNAVHLLRVAEERGLHVTIKALGAARPFGRSAAAAFDEASFTQFWRHLCAREGLAFERLTLKYGRHHNRSDNVRRHADGPRTVRADLRGFSCSRADRWFHITYDGALVLCCNDYFREQVLGNVNEADPDAIIESDTYRRVIAQVKGEVGSPPDFLCKRCESPGG